MRIDAPDAGQVPQLLSLWKQIFGDHEGFWELFLETGFSRDRCRCIQQEQQVDAALCWLDCQVEGKKFAYLYAVLTRPEARGRGLCRQLMADTHRHLAALGYAGVLLVPAEESLRDMYRKMGYRDATALSEVSCQAAAPSRILSVLSPEEFGQRRRQLLPEGSVIQEGENLCFLAGQAQLYAGPGLLLAAYQEGDVLHGLELLGDPAAAPGILKGLGFREGHFRIPGTDRPFAMFLPLQADAPVPRYFGFAFD